MLNHSKTMLPDVAVGVNIPNPAPRASPNLSSSLLWRSTISTFPFETPPFLIQTFQTVLSKFSNSIHLDRLIWNETFENVYFRYSANSLLCCLTLAEAPLMPCCALNASSTFSPWSQGILSYILSTWTSLSYILSIWTSLSYSLSISTLSSQQSFQG